MDKTFLKYKQPVEMQTAFALFIHTVRNITIKPSTLLSSDMNKTKLMYSLRNAKLYKRSLSFFKT